MNYLLGIVAVLVVGPVLAYLVMKFGTAGYLQAKRWKKEKHNESSEQ